MENFAPSGVIAEFNKTPAMHGIVAKMSENAFFSIDHVLPENEQKAYDLVVAAQATFEQAIVDGLKNGDIVSAVAVIHTGRPCNPLSYTASPDNKRTGTLEAILKAGGTIACVYQEQNKLGQNSVPDGVKKEEYQKASAYFSALQDTYPALEDYPIEDTFNELTKDMSGASYLMKTKEGKEYFYSFLSYQKQTVRQNEAARRWVLWAGEVEPDFNACSKDVIKKKYEFMTRMWDVNYFLKEKAGISLDTLMDPPGVSVPGAKLTLEP
jgi:hypothetical protein